VGILEVNINMTKSKLFLLLLLIFSLGICNAQSLLKGPQKIAIDAKRNRLMVSNYVSGDIVQIDNKGIQSYFQKNAGFIDGIEIIGDVIYGVGRNRKIIGYDLESTRQVLDLSISGDPDKYLSSLCSDSDGHLFISCPDLNEIYHLRLSDQTYWVYAKGNGLNKPNGILLEKEKNRIVVIDDSPSPSLIHAISLTDSTVTTLAETSFDRPDGITRDKLGNYYIGGYYLPGLYKSNSEFNGGFELFFKGNNMVYPTYDPDDNSLLTTYYESDSWIRVPLMSSYSDTTMVSHGTAIMTYISSDEHSRSIWAMVKSIREMSRSYSNSKIYIVLAGKDYIPCNALKDDNIELLPLQMDSVFANYPLAIKAFAAAQVEEKVGDDIQTLIWLDPGVLVLNSLETLDLQGKYDIALRPVTLKNNIGIPPGTEPDGYWNPIYKASNLNYKKLPAVRTIAEEEVIQPYYNCEVYSVNPKLGICKEWAIQLTDLLKNNSYQKTACSTFLRQLFLHQAVFSAVATSTVKNERLKPLPLTSSYPFNQHDQLPSASRIKSMNELTVVIFDDAWDRIPTWEDKVPSSEPLKSWLNDTYLKYLNLQK
jgi:hypothetical protein